MVSLVNVLHFDLQSVMSGLLGVCVCVRACVRACACVRVRACVHAYVCACVCV